MRTMQSCNHQLRAGRNYRSPRRCIRHLRSGAPVSSKDLPGDGILQSGANRWRFDTALTLKAADRARCLLVSVQGMAGPIGAVPTGPAIERQGRRISTRACRRLLLMCCWLFLGVFLYLSPACPFSLSLSRLAHIPAVVHVRSATKILSSTPRPRSGGSSRSSAKSEWAPVHARLCRAC